MHTFELSDFHQAWLVIADESKRKAHVLSKHFLLKLKSRMELTNELTYPIMVIINQQQMKHVKDNFAKFLKRYK